FTPHSCNCNPDSCNFTPYSCNYTPYSCNCTPYSCNYTPHSCNYTPYSCNCTPYSCNSTPNTHQQPYYNKKNDSYPPKGRATIAHQSINVCTKIFRTNSGKNNCFSSAFAISGMRRPNENISPVAKRYVRFGSSGTPSNSTSSTRSTPSSSKYVSTCK